MSKFFDTVRTMKKVLTKKDNKPKGYDVIATVTGVDGETAWVSIPSGVPETPAQVGVAVKQGDKVMVRVSGGRARVIGNVTSPPTDDTIAQEAHRQSILAYNAVKNVSEQVTVVDEKVTENAEQMAQTVIQINSDIEGLQEQIDGNITSWFYAVDPTLNNPPAIDWREEGSESVHLGDLYYNTETGYAWRWMYDGDEDEYSWMRITDVDVVKALADAAKAQDTADSKRRVFVVQPTPPYDIGDLWVQGSGGDIMRCSHARATGESYVAADWVKASKYTDDTVAQQALTSANGKNTIYHSATAPSGGTYKTGDTWFDTDDDNKIYKWNGSAWSPVLLGDDALESISANKITAGEIDASQITVSNLDAGNITSGTLDAARLNVSGIIASGNIATESDLPTKVSDLTNDSGFQNASQVDSIVTGKGYQTASQVNTAVSNGVSGKADKTDAVLEQQRIYKSVASGGSASATTTWVTETGDVNNAWTTKRPTYSSSYPVLWTAIQQKKVTGTITCTTPLKDDTLTVIDGGHITTGTIDANRINLTQAIQIGNIATGDDIPTNISDLNNDVGFMTDGSFGNLVKTPLFTDVAASLFSALNYNSKYLRYNSAGGWTKLRSNIRATYDSGTGLCKFDGHGSLGSSTADFRQALPLKQNTDYTVSMQVGSTFRFNFMGYTYISKSGWSIDGDRIYRTFNTGDNTYHMFTIEASDSRPVYINRIKVEEGSTYSGWSDYDETIGKNYETQLDTSDRLTDASNTFATNKADAAEQNAKDYADSVAGGYKNYLKFDTTTGLDVGYTNYNAKVNIKGDGVRLYNNNGNVGTYIRNDGMTVYDGLGESSPTPIFYVYANTNWSNYAKSGNATFQSALSPAPYKAEISCVGTVVGIGRVWAQNRQGTDISDYCFWNYDSRSNKMQVYISQDYSGPTPAIAYADYWVQTPARAYVGVNPSNPSNYLFVVGNGTASHPSNALSVDGFGNLAAKGYANFDRGVVASTSIGARSYADWDVYFNKTFESVPIVVATLCSSSTAYQIGNVSCSVLANSITKNKFTLRMFNADTTSRSPAVYWMATDAK